MTINDARLRLIVKQGRIELFGVRMKRGEEWIDTYLLAVNHKSSIAARPRFVEPGDFTASY